MKSLFWLISFMLAIWGLAALGRLLLSSQRSLSGEGCAPPDSPESSSEHLPPPQRAASCEQSRSKIVMLAYSAREYADLTQSAKTPEAQIHNAKKTLSILQEAAGYQECRQVIRNYDGMVERLEAIIKVVPVIAAVERSYKHRSKGVRHSELTAMMEALAEVRKSRITNTDILIAGVMPGGTGEVVQIENIERRCRELGWEGGADIEGATERPAVSVGKPSLDKQELALLDALITTLQETPVLSRELVLSKYKKYSAEVSRKMLETGKHRGEVSGSPVDKLFTSNYDAFRSRIRAIDNNLSEQVRIVSGSVDFYFEHGESPAPHYMWRIAVILRKHKQYQREAEYLDGVVKHFISSGKFLDRAARARILADRAAGGS